MASIPESALRLEAQVVLHVAGFAVGEVGVLAVKLVEDVAVRLAEDVREHVDAAAVRHAHHDFARAADRRVVDRDVEHGDERVGPLDRESLHVDVLPVDEALERVDFGQPAQQRALLVRRQVARQLLLLDHPPEPGAFVLVLRGSRTRSPCSTGRATRRRAATSAAVPDVEAERRRRYERQVLPR